MTIREWDDSCLACREVKGEMLISTNGHTCSICFACKANEIAGKRVISILPHVCTKDIDKMPMEMSYGW